MSTPYFNLQLNRLVDSSVMALLKADFPHKKEC